MNLRQIYKYSIFTIVILFVTFSLGLIRAILDNYGVKSAMSEEVLIFHIIFAIMTGGLGYYLYILASRTGLLFPKTVALGNLTAIGVAGLSGLAYLLTSDGLFSKLMLDAFEISLALSSMLIGYLYCFMRVCNR